jgi:hypothetical protein
MNLSISSRMMTLCAVFIAALFADTAVAQTYGPRAHYAVRVAPGQATLKVVARQRTAGPRDTIRLASDTEKPAQFASLDFRAAAVPGTATNSSEPCDRIRRAGPRDTIARCN